MTTDLQKTFGKQWVEALEDDVVVYDTFMNSKKILYNAGNNRIVGYKKGQIIQRFGNDIVIKYENDYILETVNCYNTDIFRVHSYNDVYKLEGIDHLYDNVYMFR
jgi:hypothetical protein